MESFGRWRVEGSLDEGGQGWTYLVRPKDGGTETFALKRLKNPKRVERFRQEIQALVTLSHPNIVRIVDHSLPDAGSSVCYYVTEFCSKGDLSKADLQQITLLRKLRLFRQVCAAVAAAHAKRLLHRDLKPANILMREDGSLAVADFGLCLDLSQIEHRMTGTTEPIGPRLYMAPELEGGRDEDPQPTCDSYSLGKLLYYFVAGRHVVREYHRQPEYSLLTPGCEEGLHFVYELLDRSVREDPSQRFQDAQEFLMELDNVIDGIERSAHVLDLSVKQRCTYCRSGTYQLQLLTGPTYGSPVSQRTSAYKFWGLNDMGNRDWMGLVCDTCGNVQMFRPDLAPRNQWKNVK